MNDSQRTQETRTPTMHSLNFGDDTNKFSWTADLLSAGTTN